MNIFFKFFIWRINLKLKRLDSEQRISFLTNELLKNIQNTGYQLINTSGFGHLPIWMHRCDSKDAIIKIDGNVCEPLFKVKPTFKFKVVNPNA